MCHILCDLKFVDPTIRYKYYGRCDDPNKIELPGCGYTSDLDWMNKL